MVYFRFILIIYFLLSPFLIYLKFKSKGFVLMWYINNFAFIFTLLIFYLTLYELFLEYLVYYFCFEFPTTSYKSDAPEWCKLINMSDYMGIGWILKLMFLSFFQSVYSLIIYIVLYVYNQFKNDFQT